MRDQRKSSSNQSRPSWSAVPLSFVSRLKNKVNQKVDKYFVNHYFGEAETSQAQAFPAPPPPPPPTPAAGAQGQPMHQYAQTTPTFECNQIDSSFEFAQHRNNIQLGLSSSQPDIMVPSASGDIYPDQYWEMGPLLECQADDGNNMLIDHHHHHHLGASAHDYQSSFLQDFDHQHKQMPISGYDHEHYGMTEITSSWQAMHINYSTRECGSTPSMSMQMSGDTVETVESEDMVDSTGDSNFTGYILPPVPVQQRSRACVIKRRFLTVADFKRILLDEDDESSRQPSRFRVVASIVYAYRRLRGLVRRKRMQRSTSCSMSEEGSVSGSCKLKRIRSADCSKVYQGIKQRKGKWVAEIRFSKLPDKIWLGSFQLEKQAALAYDAGLHHCNTKRTKIFNFKESPQKLGPSQYSSLFKLNKDARKLKVQNLARDYAMLTCGSSSNVNTR